MKIVIYDTEHFETTFAFSRVLDLPSNNLTFFVTKEVYQSLHENLGDEALKYTWFVKKESSIKFCYKLYKYCTKSNVDYLIFTTISYHHLLFGCMLYFLKIKSLLTIHDANSFFQPDRLSTLRGLLRDKGKKFLQKQITGYISLLSSTKNYIVEKFSPPQPIYVIPGGIFQVQKHKVLNQRFLNIVIPGAIEAKRRSYEQVIELLNILLQKYQGNFQFTILGKPIGEYGDAILQKINELEVLNYKIKTFDHFIPQHSYNYYLENADIIWAPLNCSFKAEDGVEKYGLSKSSGVFFDAIRYGKPLIIPGCIFVTQELRSQAIQYSSIHDLATLFIKLAEDEMFLNNITETAEKNAADFIPGKIRSTLFFLNN